MLESAGNSKSRDALLQKLRERIKERDRALEVERQHTSTRSYTVRGKVSVIYYMNVLYCTTQCSLRDSLAVEK